MAINREGEIKMLKIIIYPTSLCFKNLTLELKEEVEAVLGILLTEQNYKGYVITANPANLYKYLFKLAKVFDIEII